MLDVKNPRAPSVAASLPLPGLCRSVSRSPSGLAYVACGAGGLHVVSLDVPGGPVWVDTLRPGGPVSTVKVSGRLLVVGLISKRVKVYDLSHGSGPVLLAEHKTDRHPLHALLLGSFLHVSEASGLDWALCASGAHCGIGQQTEVLKLDRDAGSLDLVGSYAGERRAMAHSAFTGNLVVMPTGNGVNVMRAEVLP